MRGDEEKLDEKENSWNNEDGGSVGSEESVGKKKRTIEVSRGTT